MPNTYPNYINGEWRKPATTFENRNPADTSEIVGLFAKATPEEMGEAAAAAHAAYPGWSGLNAPARGALLYKVADILERKFDQLGEEMTREEGKTLPEAKGEVRRAINIFRYFGGEGSRQPGFVVPSERDRVHMFAIRKSLGVVGLVTPWNFPIAIPAWKLAPALISPGVATRHADGAHRCLGARVHQPDGLNRRHNLADQIGNVDLAARWRAVARAASKNVLQCFHHRRMPVTQNHRPPGADVIEVTVAVFVVETRAVGPFDEHRIAAHGLEGASGRVDASRDVTLSLCEQGT
jgi:hypothetical protein